MEKIETYLLVLNESLQSKKELLLKLIEFTKEQSKFIKSEIISNDENDEFDQLVSKKDVLMDEIDKIDENFNRIFDKIIDNLNSDKLKYKQDIEKLQSSIIEITEFTNQLINLEKMNFSLFEKETISLKKEVKEFKNKTKLANYIKPDIQDAYFYDKKVGRKE